MTFDEWWKSYVKPASIYTLKETTEDAWEAGVQEGIDRMYRMYDLCPECKMPYDEHRMDCNRGRTHNDCFRFNEPIRTPNHPDKAYVVVVKDGDEIKIIRFGEQYEEREWVGLTDNQVEKIRSNSQAFEDPLIYCIESAERKLKELNT